MAGPPDPAPAPGQRTYAEQLTDTLAFAVTHIPWYRDRPDQYRGPVDTPEGLARLPIIDRATVMADQRAFASTQDWPLSVSYSSSTTGGVGQPRWRSDAERVALVDYLRATAAPDAPVDDADGVSLVIHPFDQGPPNLTSADGRRVIVGMIVPWHFELIVDVLRNGWESPSGRVPITSIDCFSPGLRILTEWLEQHGVDPGALGVRRLVGYGSIQSGPWRHRLERTWGARYLDIYGLSEVILSDSAQCPLCQAYHFPLPIVPEVVDLLTREPITEGTGALLLTELHPYAQLQVMMRYWTDDIVELARPCPLGGFGIRFRGRRSSSIVVPQGDRPALVVGSLEVGEACAEVPDVALTPITWASWAHDVGPPRFAHALDGTSIRVTVELRYRPGLFPARAAHVEAELRDALTTRVPGLADALGRGAVDLVVRAVGPGDIDTLVKV